MYIGLSRIDGDEFTNMSSRMQHGNTRWLAPELLFGLDGRYPRPRTETDRPVEEGEVLKASASTDMWSFGMTMIEVLTDQVPFYGFKTDAAAIMKLGNHDLPKAAIISNKLWKAIVRCWKKDPSLFCFFHGRGTS